ncbi:hypothetical protein AB6A40_009535 [Gnathostoma spinigerum]|uniref:Small ribosomal subunit protein mS29 n=1 Tax=Gnathostoma spinigerum TaxID=75299 RepID=A0ABD6EZA5_9BILA
MRIVSAFGRAYLLANLPVKLGCRQSLIQIASYPANSSTASGQSGTEDIGCIYKVPDEDVNNLLLRENLPSVFAKQLTTLRECAWLCRKPLIEIKNCLRIVNCDTPNLRIVLWGKFGSGKTITLYQALHYAYSKEWIIFCVRSAMYLTRRAKEIQMSSYRSGRIDCPHQAVQLLQKFKTNNARNWNKLAVCVFLNFFIVNIDRQ